jgi:hypothetical protein
MIAAVLSFLAALFNSLPKVIDTVSEWSRARAATKAKQAKDERNAQAIRDAGNPPAA